MSEHQYARRLYINFVSICGCSLPTQRTLHFWSYVRLRKHVDVINVINIIDDIDYSAGQSLFLRVCRLAAWGSDCPCSPLSNATLSHTRVVWNGSFACPLNVHSASPRDKTWAGTYISITNMCGMCFCSRRALGISHIGSHLERYTPKERNYPSQHKKKKTQEWHKREQQSVKLVVSTVLSMFDATIG